MASLSGISEELAEIHGLYLCTVCLRLQNGCYLLHQATGTLQTNGYINNSGLQQNHGYKSLQFIPKGFKVEIVLPRRQNRSIEKRIFVSQASTSHISVANPVSSPSNGTTADSRKKTNEAALILIRHGESLWNEKNLFMGFIDVPLTKKGVEEAIEAGKRIINIPVDKYINLCLYVCK